MIAMRTTAPIPTPTIEQLTARYTRLLREADALATLLTIENFKSYITTHRHVVAFPLLPSAVTVPPYDGKFIVVERPMPVWRGRFVRHLTREELQAAAAVAPTHGALASALGLTASQLDYQLHRQRLTFTRLRQIAARGRA
jgi:hypothetical protein